MTRRTTCVVVKEARSLVRSIATSNASSERSFPLNKKKATGALEHGGNKLAAVLVYCIFSNWKTWVWHEVQENDQCTVLRDYKIEHVSCDVLLPFICQKSALAVNVNSVSWDKLFKFVYLVLQRRTW